MREIFDRIAGLILVGEVLFIIIIGSMPGLVESGIISFKTMFIVFGIGLLSLVWIYNSDDEEDDDE